MKFRELLRINEARFKLPGHFRGRLEGTVLEKLWADRIDREMGREASGGPPDLGERLGAEMDTDTVLGAISAIASVLGALLGLAYAIGMAIHDDFGILGWIVAPILLTGLGATIGAILPRLIWGTLKLAVVLAVVGGVIWLIVKLVSIW